MTAAPYSPAANTSKALVLYDGVCGLCNRFVTFLLRHDRRDSFRFAPLQSEPARAALLRHGLDISDMDTVVVVPGFGGPDERALLRADAVLWSMRELGGIWRMATAARILPPAALGAGYRWIARRRYRIFGKSDTCPVPRPEDRHKFLVDAAQRT